MKNKAQQIRQQFNAVPISQEEAEQIVQDTKRAVICVVENQTFDAAAFCHSPAEFKRFSSPDDPRRKTWLVVQNREVIEQITKYPH